MDGILGRDVLGIVSGYLDCWLELHAACWTGKEQYFVSPRFLQWMWRQKCYDDRYASQLEHMLLRAASTGATEVFASLWLVQEPSVDIAPKLLRAVASSGCRHMLWRALQWAAREGELVHERGREHLCTMARVAVQGNQILTACFLVGELGLDPGYLLGMLEYCVPCNVRRVSKSFRSWLAEYFPDAVANTSSYRDSCATLHPHPKHCECRYPCASDWWQMDYASSYY